MFLILVVSHIFRPNSQYLLVLSINPDGTLLSWRLWAPFFLRPFIPVRTVKDVSGFLYGPTVGADLSNSKFRHSWYWYSRACSFSLKSMRYATPKILGFVANTQLQISKASKYSLVAVDDFFGLPLIALDCQLHCKTILLEQNTAGAYIWSLGHVPGAPCCTKDYVLVWQRGK